MFSRSVVADVAKGSLAACFCVQKGDVVVEINGAKIATTRDLDAASGQRPRYWDLTIVRGGQTIRSRIGG
jgi:S1-C subfamily serine protease